MEGKSGQKSDGKKGNKGKKVNRTEMKLIFKKKENQSAKLDDNQGQIEKIRAGKKRAKKGGQRFDQIEIEFSSKKNGAKRVDGTEEELGGRINQAEDHSEDNSLRKSVALNGASGGKNGRDG